MNRVEIADRFARMYSSARHAAGVSQAQAAKVMGVSKSTIQNWESGISSPSAIQTFVYFKHLGIQPLPYYLQLIYPVEFDWTREQAKDEEVDKALETLLRDLPVDAKRKILYIAYGDHGSSPMAVLDLICAHLHTPLVARIGVAELYEDGMIDREEYRQKRDKLREDLARMPEPEQAHEVTLPEDWREMYAQLSRDGKRTFWHEVVREIKIYRDHKIEIVF